MIISAIKIFFKRLFNSDETLFDYYDKRGVRVFVKYASETGKYAVECYRKKAKEELSEDERKLGLTPENNWRLTRVSCIQSYEKRQTATAKAFEIAQNICDEFGL